MDVGRREGHVRHVSEANVLPKVILENRQEPYPAGFVPNHRANERLGDQKDTIPRREGQLPEKRSPTPLRSTSSPTSALRCATFDLFCWSANLRLSAAIALPSGAVPSAKALLQAVPFGIHAEGDRQL